MTAWLALGTEAASSTINLPPSVLATLVAAIVTAPTLAALGVTKWLMKQAERQRADEKIARKERDDLVRAMNEELRAVSANNARTVEVLATLANNVIGATNNIAALDKRVVSVEHSLDEGVSASLEAHARTREAVERVEAFIQRRTPRQQSGRADAPALFLIAASSALGLSVSDTGTEGVASESREHVTDHDASYQQTLSMLRAKYG